MRAYEETVSFCSDGDTVRGVLFLPAWDSPSPALIICHGAMEFKENYFELCHFLVEKGVAALALDMHGHGQSEGERFHVDMRWWVADIRAAIAFLENHPEVDEHRIGAFGFSSGGTAVLEAALVEPRLRALITLDATVRSVLSFPETLVCRILITLGGIKRMLTKQDLRLSLAKMVQRRPVASDPEINRRILSDWRSIEAYSSFPFPGAAQIIFVDTIKRVNRITVPTLVLHGGDDQLDPPQTARLLYDALTCEKELYIIPGNGHAGHVDRHKDRVMKLTADWALKHLARGARGPDSGLPVQEPIGARIW